MSNDSLVIKIIYGRISWEAVIGRAILKAAHERLGQTLYLVPTNVIPCEINVNYKKIMNIKYKKISSHEKTKQNKNI